MITKKLKYFTFMGINYFNMEYQFESEEKQLKKVRKNGYYIKNPTNSSQLYVIHKNWKLIRYISNPCLAAQKLAITKNVYSLCYFNNPDIEIQLLALENGLIINKQFIARDKDSGNIQTLTICDKYLLKLSSYLIYDLANIILTYMINIC